MAYGVGKQKGFGSLYSDIMYGYELSVPSIKISGLS
jgi:hypothetical protein